MDEIDEIRAGGWDSKIRAEYQQISAGSPSPREAIPVEDMVCH